MARSFLGLEVASARSQPAICLTLILSLFPRKHAIHQQLEPLPLARAQYFMCTRKEMLKEKAERLMLMCGLARPPPVPPDAGPSREDGGGGHATGVPRA